MTVVPRVDGNLKSHFFQDWSTEAGWPCLTLNEEQVDPVRSSEKYYWQNKPGQPLPNTGGTRALGRHQPSWLWGAGHRVLTPNSAGTCGLLVKMRGDRSCYLFFHQICKTEDQSPSLPKMLNFQIGRNANLAATCLFLYHDLNCFQVWKRKLQSLTQKPTLIHRLVRVPLHCCDLKLGLFSVITRLKRWVLMAEVKIVASFITVC